jgi:potassium efflux system protein
MKAFRAILLLGASACAFGQQVTMADVSRLRERLTRAKGLTDAERNEISALYDQSAQFLQQEIRWNAQQVGNARTMLLIESELASATSAANQPGFVPPPPRPSETAQQVEEEFTRVRNDRASRMKLRDDLSKLDASLTKRRDAIAARRSEIEQTVQSLDDETSVLALVPASPLWLEAQRMALQSRRQALNQELGALAAERDASDVRQKLISVQRDAHLLKLDADGRYLAELDARKDAARMRDARKSLQDTVNQAQTLATGFPQLSALASEIRSRATDLWGSNGIEARSDKAAAQAREMRASKSRFDQITASTLARYENSGWLSSAAEWWPPKVEQFGKIREVAVLLVAYRAAETRARRNLFRLEEETNNTPAFDTEVQQLLDGSAKRTGDSDFVEFKNRARSILQLKRRVTAELLNNDRIAVSRFSEARTAAQELLASIRELQSFVMKHVLWSRSVSGPVLPSPTSCGRAVLWFFSLEEWSRIASGFASARAACLFWIGGLAVLIALCRVRGRLARAFATSRWRGDDPGRLRDFFFRTILMLIWTLPGPLAIAYTGWVIGQAAPDADLAEAIGGGAANAARFLFVVLVVRRLLVNGGATDRLMNWPEAARQALDRAMRRLALVFTPLWFVSSALAESGLSFHNDPVLQAHNNSLGRLCFLAAVLSFLVIGVQVLQRKRALATALGAAAGKGGLSRPRVARWTLILVFFVAFLLALTGYYITGLLLVRDTLRTVAWTVALMLLHYLLRAWRLSQRARAFGSESPQTETQAEQADIQMRRLTRFGLTLVWIAGGVFIWSATLPSVSLLNRVELLPHFRVAVERPPDVPTSAAVAQPSPAAEAPKVGKQESTQTTPTPGPGPAAGPVATSTSGKSVQAAGQEPLYLSDLLIALLIGVLISMLVGNIPGLLHFTVFRRVKLDVGGRYAVTTVTRYVAIAIGVLVISAILGLNWSKVQWLAAALTFGIGFGLQEIFANFAAGMILLFDRSIRVGDVVSVGNLSGVVARIQMRATTVTLWDRSDMVVPNKEFITSKLVNWTLSNSDTRVDLKVGVDYGSDVEKVREVLLRVAQMHPAVLREPPPQVLLTEFGASAISFELQVFGLYAYGRPVLLDELHRAVLREFSKENIVMAFPQLDVHLHAASAAVGE